jgi:hypothetical protein
MLLKLIRLPTKENVELLVLKQPKENPHTTDGPVKTDDLIVIPHLLNDILSVAIYFYS